MKTKEVGELMEEKIKQLLGEMEQYNIEYYTHGTPSITDDHYYEK